MNAVRLPSDERVPSFGMGTWHMGEDPKARVEELATLRLGIELGATLIDTAEMYGDGRAEELVGEAIKGQRNKVFLVSKVLPSHASRRGTVAACEASLRRLGTDRLDLYLLHWSGGEPIADTVAAFEDLRSQGKIRHWGVSNRDLREMKELRELPGGSGAQTNQLLYNLSRRGIEWDLLPLLRERRVPVMAYSPIEQARLLENQKLIRFARAAELTPAQAALAWLLAKKDVIVIPKTSRRERLKENLRGNEAPTYGRAVGRAGSLVSTALRSSASRHAIVIFGVFCPFLFCFLCLFSLLCLTGILSGCHSTGTS